MEQLSKRLRRRRSDQEQVLYYLAGSLLCKPWLNLAFPDRWLAEQFPDMSFRQPNEDLFETSRMTFGEHLEELRGVLIKALVAIAIGCGIGFFFAEHVVKILVEPLASAMEDYDRETARRSIAERDGEILAGIPAADR